MKIQFYVIIIVVLMVKILFWTLYLCIRRRRQQRNRSNNRTVETCYEEVPAVPQPAYVFSGLSPEDLRHALLIESLPGYQHDDPYKTDLPPPTYDQSFHAEGEHLGQSSSSGRNTLDELVETMESTDTARLMENQDDDFICLQQMS